MLNFLTYRLFRSRKWNYMSVSGRQKALQRLEYIESKRLGREELSINIVPMPENMLGQCDYKGKAIYLNEQLLSTPNMQFIAMITLFHEGRHAYQYSVVSNKKHISRFSKAYKWKQNMQNYIRYDGHDKFSYYSMQEVERDTTCILWSASNPCIFGTERKMPTLPLCSLRLTRWKEKRPLLARNLVYSTSGR